MENSPNGTWLFVGLCCIGPIVWGGIWWAIGRFITVRPEKVGEIFKRRQL